MTVRTGSFPFLLPVSVLVLILSFNVIPDVTCKMANSLNKTLTLKTDGHLYPLTYRPWLVGLNMRHLFWNERIVRLLAHCLFYGQPCDTVGQFTQPRFMGNLMGPCVKCTKEQEDWIPTALETIADRFPLMYRALMAKFLEYMEIEVPKAERLLIARMFE